MKKTHRTPSASPRLLSTAAANFRASLPFVFALPVLALLLVLLPSARAAAQFSQLTIAGKNYDATQNQNISAGVTGNATWTAATNTLTLDGRVTINGNIAFSTTTPSAVATINASGNVSVNGSITSQGALFVNASGNLTINGNLGGSLTVTGGNVKVNGNVTGSLSASSGTVKVNGNVGGTLTVSSGVVTIDGTVAGAKNITGGVVKINGSTVSGPTTPPVTNVSLDLSTATPGSSGSGSGWNFNGVTLFITGSGNNYTLNGAAPAGISVCVTSSAVNSTLTLNGVAINNTAAASNYAALEINGSNLTIYVKGNNNLIGRSNAIWSLAYGPLTLDAASGATLTATGGGGLGLGYEGIACDDSDLVLQGSGTFNFRSGSSAADMVYGAIYVGGDLLVQGSATVNADAGDYTGANPADSGMNDGVYCFGTLTIAGHAKLNATGGSALGAGCLAGGGVTLLSRLTVTSDAANALTATGGAGAIVQTGYGHGIGAVSSLVIAGTGSIKAEGDHGIAAVYDITISGGKITADADNAGYALYAGGYNGASFTGGTVTIAGGTVTATNTNTPANIYYKNLNHTAGTYNGVTKTPDSGGTGTGGGNTNGGNTSGGGGGGAPTPVALAALAVLCALRARKK
jgi:hypothetical protein